MPLVRVRYVPEFAEQVGDLKKVLRHVVPAGYSSEDGLLTPGSIIFIADPAQSHDELTVDVFVEAEAYFKPKRTDIEERSKLIGEALEEIFPGTTFAVWPKLVNAGWFRRTEDPEFEGDLSMPAAIERAEAAISR
ncbi:MAG: hypothetical protein WD889_03110 [Candidatus Colwellbacteria bacterium]